MSQGFSLSKTVKARAPSLPYEQIKDRVLGRGYELSLVFIGKMRSRRLNRLYRGKDKVANVLSFPLAKKSGEIFITLSETKLFGVEKLFIHGLLHLKGMQHGATMDKTEAVLQRQYFNGTSHRRRGRHRYRRD